ncbi:PRC-barrel domain-containing protein [Lentibacillus sp. CBA3610]|uniref:PRC-barrel domain-containing protein n=1 Tax=Lentibacillus sp. CBA3610 TaxID=2518176 RepID=UPI001595BB76|nr:PRC-barrel domain-containing protein [Lentibacillus sp. CBA3610]QKY68475.1 PRC-barrel domain containing protein [Lentibacillus sp. CBA3610]
MLFFASDLNEYNIDASDGQMGKIQDLYFDDDKWVVRYAVLDVRKWLPSRRILLSLGSFQSIDSQNQRINVEHDKETVRNSPSIPADAPFSKDLEIALTGYYGWSRYWLGGMLWGTEDIPGTNTDEQLSDEDRFMQESEHYLRSEVETRAFRVHANDGKAGAVADFLIDDVYWKIRYVAVQKGDFAADDKLLLIEPGEIQSVDWMDGHIYINSSLKELNELTSYGSKDEVTHAS